MPTLSTSPVPSTSPILSTSPSATGRTRPVDVVRRGVTATLPVALSLAPFGLVVGIATAGVGVSGVTAAGLGALLLSGAGHLAAVGVIAGGGSALAVVLTAALVNLRLLLYSASMAASIRALPLPGRVLASLAIIDQSVVIDAMERGDDEFAPWWSSVGLTLVGVWSTAVGIGSVVGDVLPASVPTGIAAPAAFIALLVPQLSAPRARRAAAAAAVVAAVTTALPPGTGIACALVAAFVVTPPRRPA